MKIPRLLRSLGLLAIAAAAAVTLPAAERPGPRGGRLLELPPHYAEFFVTAERKLELTFLDRDLKPLREDRHAVTVLAELPGGRQTIALTATEHGYVSTAPLPAGDPYRIVLQFSTGPQGKRINNRLDLNLAPCGECERPEYACLCDH